MSPPDKPPARLELLPGTLEMLILKALSPGPMHGYAIVRRLQHTTEGVLQVEEGSLYPALHRMDRRGWIRSEWGQSELNRRAKFYALTRAGRRELAAQRQSWERMSHAIAQVMEANAVGLGGSAVAFLEEIGLFLGSPDTRPRHQVVDDISEELEFHLAMRARENEEAGMAPTEARRAAEVRFGDVRDIRARCARIQIGEWKMLQRVNLVLMVVLLGIAAYLGLQLSSSRSEAAEMVGELRGEIGELAAAIRASREPAAPELPPSGSVLFADTDGDGLPDTRILAGEEREAVDPGPRDPREWLARFDEEMTWREVVAIGREIAALGPDEALAVMRAIYADLPTVFARQQILKAFVFDGGQPCAVHVLHLAASDPELAVQGWAFTYLKDYAFQDFSDDYEGYLAWYGRLGDWPLDQLLTRSAVEAVERLRGLSGAELARALRELEDLDLGKGAAAGVDLAAVMRDAGLLDCVRGWMAAGDDESRRIAASWLAELRPDEGWLRQEVAPLLRGSAEYDPAMVGAACSALGQPGNTWAVEPLIDSLRWAQSGEPGFVFDHASALAEIGDPRAIPALIALIAVDDTYDTVYGIGYFALKDLTGVSYDESHDGAFWLAWWEENRDRLPAEVQALELPALEFHR